MPDTEVHVRIGEHRSAYHTNPSCPALNGKQETYRGRTTMPRRQAEEQSLKPCLHCKNHPPA